APHPDHRPHVRRALRRGPRAARLCAGGGRVGRRRRTTARPDAEGGRTRPDRYARGRDRRAALERTARRDASRCSGGTRSGAFSLERPAGSDRRSCADSHRGVGARSSRSRRRLHRTPGTAGDDRLRAPLDLDLRSTVRGHGSGVRGSGRDPARKEAQDEARRPRAARGPPGTGPPPRRKPERQGPLLCRGGPGRGADRRAELLHRQVPRAALPAADLPGRRHRVRHPLGGPRRDQRDRDRLRPQPQRLLRRRTRLDAVHARHVEGLRRRRQPRRSQGPVQPGGRDLRGRPLFARLRRRQRSAQGRLRVQPRRLVRRLGPPARPRPRRPAGRSRRVADGSDSGPLPGSRQGQLRGPAHFARTPSPGRRQRRLRGRVPAGAARHPDLLPPRSAGDRRQRRPDRRHGSLRAARPLGQAPRRLRQHLHLRRSRRNRDAPPRSPAPAHDAHGDRPGAGPAPWRLPSRPAGLDHPQRRSPCRRPACRGPRERRRGRAALATASRIHGARRQGEAVRPSRPAERGPHGRRHTRGEARLRADRRRDALRSLRLRLAAAAQGRPRGRRHGPGPPRRRARRPRTAPALRDPSRGTRRAADRPQAHPRRLEAARVDGGVSRRRAQSVLRSRRQPAVGRADPAHEQGGADAPGGPQSADRHLRLRRARHPLGPDRPPGPGFARVPRRLGSAPHRQLAEVRARLLHRERQRVTSLLWQCRRHRRRQRHPDHGPSGLGVDHRHHHPAAADPAGHHGAGPDHLADEVRRNEQHLRDGRPRRPHPRGLATFLRREAGRAGTGVARRPPAPPVDRPRYAPRGDREPARPRAPLALRGQGRAPGLQRPRRRV
ncbi:MAG: GH23 / GH103, partial [uncultured Solirubrobacteraceae bacterium]